VHTSGLAATFADDLPVPLMVEGTLDEGGVGQLFADLSAAAEVNRVLEKWGDLAGTARAVRPHDRFDGRDWTDTVFA
jgi:hypothetical protein